MGTATAKGELVVHRPPAHVIRGDRGGEGLTAAPFSRGVRCGRR
jgi:precorrin isomerase